MNKNKELIKMKLYLISQEENNDYDTCDSAVVCAESEEEAKLIHPSGFNDWNNSYNQSWASKPENVEVEYIGEAKKGLKKGVVISSFNAG